VAGKCVASGATITGILKKKDFCDFESCSKINVGDGVILMLSEMVLIDPCFMT
jgi:hypothetical protein